VAGLVGRALGRVRSVEPEVIVALAAVELVVLSGALDEVVVLLALDHVGAVSAAEPGVGAAFVVSLAAADDVVALHAGRGVGAGFRADDVVPRGAGQVVVSGGARDRAVFLRARDAVERSM